MENEEYVETLENLIIFLCQTYTEIEETLREKYKEGNKALLEIPRIQGIENIKQIRLIGGQEFRKPRYGFKDVRVEIERKRTKTVDMEEVK